MKKLIIILILFAGCESISKNENNKADSIFSYLNSSKITMIQVQEYDSLNSSDYTVERTLTNEDTINQLVALLQKLPYEGDIMVKWGGSASFHRVILGESFSKYNTIDIVDRRIKTPKTSFYEPEKVEEKEFVQLLLGAD